MSLFNRGGNTPSTIIINQITRSRNESFGDSVMKDAALAAGPAAKITNNVYRKKALKALEKRNATLGNESEYLNMLCNMNVGDNVSVFLLSVTLELSAPQPASTLAAIVIVISNTIIFFFIIFTPRLFCFLVKPAFCFSHSDFCHVFSTLCFNSSYE